MDSNIWYLVIFTSSSDKPQMEYVLDFWIKPSENKVLWPPYKNSASILSAINNRKEPDQTWILYDVQTIWWKCRKCFNYSYKFSPSLLMYYSLYIVVYSLNCLSLLL